MDFIGYDLETSGDEDGFALQPWRVQEGKARITLSAAYFQGKRKVDTEYHSALVGDLRKAGKRVALWNGIFDIAWLYASDIDVSGIMWMDAMLLWKFLENGQSGPMQWTLKAGAKRFLKDWPKLDEFIALKSEDLPDPSDPYWLERVSMDAEATALIAEIIWPRLTEKQQRLALIQSVSLPAIAASWVNGVRLNVEAVQAARPGIIEEMIALEKELGLYTPAKKYAPSKVLRSPMQMRTLLYDEWGLQCTRYTEKEAKSTDKAALTYLADIDDRVQTILKWRELNTILSKFINGPIECCEYLGSNVTHAAPKLFSTYTGRMTYSSKSMRKHRIGIPLHQTPRKKEIRSYVTALHDDEYIVEFDAKGQEVRMMAVMSKDPEMLKLFNSPPPYDDGHSLMGAKIGGISFEEMLQRKAAKDPLVVGGDGLRAAGKFITLSSAYRSGPATARRIARVQYNINIDIPTAKKWQKAYQDLFKSVPVYWNRSPKEARIKGYAETIAGRRYYLTRWQDLSWGTSSSAINFPIQGLGADQRDLATAVLVTEHPELWNKLYFDLHDGLYFRVSKQAKVSYVQAIGNTLDNINYKKYWGIDLPIPFPWEGSFGETWGSKIDIPDKKDPLSGMTLEEYYMSKRK